MASDRVEVDTARPFRSVKEAVAVFGERILVGANRSRLHANDVAAATLNTKQEESSGSSSTITLSPNAMAEANAEAEATTAIVPMYSAPSSPPSFTSSRSANRDDGDDEHDGLDEEAGGIMVMSSVKKLEEEVAETRHEVVQLRKRSTEMEMAVASLNAQLHRGLSRLAEMEPDKASAAARRRSIGGDSTDMKGAAIERWAEKSSGYSSEYLPSFSHALSLGEIDGDDDDDLLGGGGGRRSKTQKVKPIVPLIGDILFSKSFSKRKSSKDSGDLYSVC